MDEFKELLGAKKQYLGINLEKSKEMLCRGLRYFIGDNAKWLQGYDDGHGYGCQKYGLISWYGKQGCL